MLRLTSQDVSNPGETTGPTKASLILTVGLIPCFCHSSPPLYHPLQDPGGFVIQLRRLFWVWFGWCVYEVDDLKTPFDHRVSL